MMTKTAITIERVLDLIAAYGAEPGGWPEAEREAAETLLMEQPELFEAALNDARTLDQILEREALPEPSSDLAARILANAPVEAVKVTARTDWLKRFLPGHIRLPAGAALASMVLGLVAGYSYAGSLEFEAYLTGDSVYAFDAEDSFEDWLGSEEGTR